MTSKELVRSTLEFRNTDGRVPRQLWTLPWAHDNCPDMMEKLQKDFEWDFDGPETHYAKLFQNLFCNRTHSNFDCGFSGA